MPTAEFDINQKGLLLYDVTFVDIVTNLPHSRLIACPELDNLLVLALAITDIEFNSELLMKNIHYLGIPDVYRLVPPNP